MSQKNQEERPWRLRSTKKDELDKMIQAHLGEGLVIERQWVDEDGDFRAIMGKPKKD